MQIVPHHFALSRDPLALALFGVPIASPRRLNRGGASFARLSTGPIASPRAAAYPEFWHCSVLGVPQQIEELPCRTKSIRSQPSRWPEPAPRFSHLLRPLGRRMHSRRTRSRSPTLHGQLAPPIRQRPRKSSATKTSTKLLTIRAD